MGIDDALKEILKQLFLIIITAACVCFVLYVLFSGNIAGETGIFKGVGNIYSSMLSEDEIRSDGISYIENLGEQTAPKLEYISGAQTAGRNVIFKSLFLVTLDDGVPKSGTEEDGFAIYLKDICDTSGNSVVSFFKTDEIEGMDEVSSSFIYDTEQDILYFHKSGTFTVRENGKVGTMNEVINLSNWESQKITDEETGEETTRLQVYMNSLAEKYGDDYPPVRDYRKLKDGAPDTVRSVILMVNSMLSICETAEVKRIFSDNDIDIREIGSGEKKTILFLVLPDNNPVYNWIISMFYTQAFDILIRHSDDELRKPLPNRVEFWMDEFYAGAKPADADVLLGVVRSRNICMIPVLQSFSQLKSLYKDDKWEIIMDNTSAVVFMGSGPTAEATHKYVSELLGKSTIDTRNDNIHFGNNGNSGLNFAKQGRELMTPGEVKRMPVTDSIIFLKSSQPIYDTKAIPFDKPEYGYYAPKWLKERYSKALSKGDYVHPVYTIYDPVHFHYITVKRDIPLQIVTDKKDMEALQRAALKKEQDVYTFNVDEEELLYLSWGENKYTQEDVEEMYHKAMEDKKLRAERMKGLIVLQNADNVPNFGTEQEGTDKTGWEQYKSLKSLIANHWDDLSLPEQEEICYGIDDGLTEEQLRMLMLSSLPEMEMLRRAFVLESGI